MNQTDRDLARLGDLLEERIAHQLAAPRRRRRRRLAAGGMAAALALSGTAAYASRILPDSDEVERGLPGGAVIFEGTEPSCTTSDGIVFQCVLQNPPADDTPPSDGDGSRRGWVERGGELYLFAEEPDLERLPGDSGDWRVVEEAHPPDPVPNHKGSAQIFADDDNRIAGGCRGLDREGLHWECYAGERAVDEGIIVTDLLGDKLRAPTRG